MFVVLVAVLVLLVLQFVSGSWRGCHRIDIGGVGWRCMWWRLLDGS